MTKFIDNLYKVFAYHLPETTLESLTERVLKKGYIAIIPFKFPTKEYLYLTEAFDSRQLTKERKIARTIYRNMLNYIYEYLTPNEQDMINIYKTYGSAAFFPYDIDEYRLSSIYHILDDNNSFDVNTEFGDLKFKFAERKEYSEAKPNTLMGYDDELKAFIIFIDDGKNITTKDIVDLFLDTDNKHLHELQHYIDNITKQVINKKYNSNDDIEYVNDPDEFKANLQMIIGSFGKFLFKNGNKIEFDKLKDKNYITKLFNIFIGKVPSFVYQNVINNMAQDTFYSIIMMLNDENKKEFYNQLYKYISDYYGTKDDLDFNESRKKQELMRLFRLEENFMK